MSLTKEAFLEAVAAMPRVKEVVMPAGVPSAYVRQLSQADAERFLQGEDNRDLFALLAMCDEDGNRLFSDADMATVAALPFVVKSRVWIEGGRFNGILLLPEGSEKN